MQLTWDDAIEKASIWCLLDVSLGWGSSAVFVMWYTPVKMIYGQLILKLRNISCKFKEILHISNVIFLKRVAKKHFGVILWFSHPENMANVNNSITQFDNFVVREPSMDGMSASEEDQFLLFYEQVWKMLRKGTFINKVWDLPPPLNILHKDRKIEIISTFQLMKCKKDKIHHSNNCKRKLSVKNVVHHILAASQRPPPPRKL